MSYDAVLTDLRQRIYTFITTVVGHNRVFTAKTNYPRPKQQYLTYRINSDDAHIYSALIGQDNNGREIRDTTHYFDIEINCYKDLVNDGPPVTVTTPRSVITNLYHHMQSTEIQYAFFGRHNIGFVKNFPIRDRTVPIDNHDWEQRSSIVLRFHMVIRESGLGVADVSGIVNQVLFEDQVDEGSKRVTQTGTVTGPNPP